jgi:hypothetical protein
MGKVRVGVLHGLIKSNGTVSRSKDTCSRRSMADVQWR